MNNWIVSAYGSGVCRFECILHVDHLVCQLFSDVVSCLYISFSFNLLSRISFTCILLHPILHQISFLREKEKAKGREGFDFDAFELGFLK
ncbi:hypothetical protein RJT34_04181 [Clitoria ternatea]|uniref:Uncharacterized protein n=1 Tax=Clitoria ternatea TaxID=43366 RepID=A0AAN9Q0D2_CLITE